MVGGRGEPPQLYDEIGAAVPKLPNLKFFGFIPYHKVNEFFRRASVFVNTSSVEGFPNTFIQAWDHYIPVVSLNVDPDNIIQNEKVGFLSGTLKKLVSIINNNKLKTFVGLGQNAFNSSANPTSPVITRKNHANLHP